MKLVDVHQAFIDGIYQSDKETALDFIRDRENMNSEACLAVYRGSVFGNLSSALKDIYPALTRCVGDTFFEAMAIRYIKRYPSRSASLDHYGEYMAEFVAGFPPLTDYVYVADLACLEWAWHRAFHSIDQQPLKLSTLSDIDESKYDQLVFVLSDSITLIDTPHPIKDIWQKCLTDVEEGSEELVDLDAGAQRLMIWRAEGYEMRVDSLSTLEYDLIVNMQNKKNLGTILLELQSKHLLEEINQVLAKAIQFGWLVDYKLDA